MVCWQASVLRVRAMFSLCSRVYCVSGRGVPAAVSDSPYPSSCNYSHTPVCCRHTAPHSASECMCRRRRSSLITGHFAATVSSFRCFLTPHTPAAQLNVSVRTQGGHCTCSSQHIVVICFGCAGLTKNSNVESLSECDLKLTVVCMWCHICAAVVQR